MAPQEETNENTTNDVEMPETAVAALGDDKNDKNGLVWSGVQMKVLEKKGSDKVKLNILKDVWGKAEAGKTTAIMGASGAGKTSLFQVLTGRTPSQGNLVVEGDMYLNGVKIDPTNRNHRLMFAYVAQEDALHETSTARECLRFSARLRLPKTTSDDEISALVDGILAKLGLQECADTLIGGAFAKGLSGGQKRRVSIGIELVASPSIIFLDEPTSGLDSFAAAQVMTFLQQMASEEGKTVVFTIHQPSSKIFGIFDDLILLNKGRVMHQGSISNLRADFEANQHPMPENYNPADWVLEVSQTNTVEELTATGFFETEPEDHTAVRQNNKLLVPAAARDNRTKDPVSFFTEFKMLQQREFQNFVRSPIGVVINVAMTSVLSLIFSVIFWGIANQPRESMPVVQGVLGATANILVSTLFGQSNPAMMVFSKDRPVFLREYSTDHYTIVPYFLSKLYSEAFNSGLTILTQTIVVYWTMGFDMSFGQLFAVSYALALTSTAVAVMLGAAFTDPNNAMTLFPLIIVPQLFFSGVFIPIELIPVWVRWGQYLCSTMYASRLAYAYEFGSCDSSVLAQANCDVILDGNNVVLDDVWWYWIALMMIFVLFRLIGIYLLRANATY